MTLAHIHRLVLAGVRFVVSENDSRAVVTRSVLLQVLVERARKGKLNAREEALRRLIRSRH